MNSTESLPTLRQATKHSSNCRCRTGSSLNAHCGKKHSIEELVKTGSDINNFYLSRWQLDSLADYVYNEHHQYFYNEPPVISDLLQCVAGDAEANLPQAVKLLAIFDRLKQELGKHLQSEKRILFPYIKKMLSAKRNGATLSPQTIPNVGVPIHVMEAEDETVKSLFNEIQEITDDYIPCAIAPTRMKVLYQKLKALHENFRHYLFIENTILFPKVVKLEGELKLLGLVN